VDLIYDGNIFTPEAQTITLDDKRLSDVWGEKIYRLSLNAQKMLKQGTYTIKIKIKK